MSSDLKATLSGLDSDQVIALVRRLQLGERLVRRLIEEQVAAVVPHDDAWLGEQRAAFCGDRSLDEVLQQHGWSEEELTLHLWCPQALSRFADQRFAAGAEEEFLRQGSDADQVVYSLLRTRNGGLARELWIRAEEGEASFAELAKQYGEGPEATHMGVIGPATIGALHPPLLADTLRRLQPGELHAPQQLAGWWLLIRLEKLTPASFDAAMRRRLIDQQMDAFLADRVKRFQAGETLDPLHYDA